MYKNFLKITFRNLWRNKTYSFINIAGLTVGTACCFFILLYVMEQYRYDRHHTDGEAVYRIVTDIKGGDNSFISAASSPPIAPQMAADFPEIENWTRICNPPNVSHHIISYENTSFYETKGYYVDSTFFDLFTYQWIEGNPETALDQPYSVVLTQPMAEKLFGRQSPIGKVIHINNRFGDNEFKVNGVVDATAYNSHIRANFYMCMNSGGMGEWILNNNHWAGNNFIYAYVKLKPNQRPQALAAKLPDFLQQYGAEQLKEYAMEKVLSLEPLQDIHLFSERSNQLDTTISARLLYILLTIAGFIQLIACINFMNLTTARSTKRAKEVGIRKTIGASQNSLVRRFLSEAFIISFLAIIIAIPLVQSSLPWLNQLTNSALQAGFNQYPMIWLAVSGLVLLTGLLAGSYPAFYLSRFQAAKVLKGNFKNEASAIFLRKGLVITQFTIATVLVIGTLLINQQIQYMQKKDLGFSSSQKIIVPSRTEGAQTQLQNFKNQILQNPNIAHVTNSRTKPGHSFLPDFGVYREGQTMENAHIVQSLHTDEDYLTTMNIPLLSGRDFITSDTNQQLILNRTAVERLGLRVETASNHTIYSDWQGERYAHPIIGVVEDFHFQNLRQQITPMVIQYRPHHSLNLSILNAKTDDYSTLLSDIEKTWASVNPNVPFEYSFVDEDLQKQYKVESNLSNIITAFMLVAILISCMGLFGLSTFTAEQRRKEVGIRKILGASTASIVGLLSKDFIKLVFIALLLATPLAWYFMDNWLADFAYRIHIPWWVFVVTSAIALSIAFLTVSFQSIKAALTNPVNSLKNE